MSSTKDPFGSIDEDDMQRVTGGVGTIAATMSSSSDPTTEMELLLNQITQSIQTLQQNSGGMDQNTMLMMMLLMGGHGGGFGPPAPPPPNVVSVNAPNRRGR